VKVSDLIELLSAYDEDMEVRIAYDYGDHTHTHVAVEINDVDIQSVEDTSYPFRTKRINWDDDDDHFDIDDNIEEMVIIR
jgi:hypothetical protein